MSPYLEAKVNRWSEDKKELVIEDCDRATFNILVEYMYGFRISMLALYQDPETLMKLLEMSDRWQMDDLKATVMEKLILQSQDLEMLNKLREMANQWQMEYFKTLAGEFISRRLLEALPFSEFNDKTEMSVQMKLKSGKRIVVKYRVSCLVTMQSVINKVAAKMEEEVHKVGLICGITPVLGTSLAASFGGCKLFAKVTERVPDINMI